MDSAIEESTYEEDEALTRIINLSLQESCRETLMDLLEMPFAVFFHLEMQSWIRFLRDEERKYNERQLIKNR